MAIRDHLNGLWSDEDFDEWYPRDGKPGLSPAQLATVSVLQFLLELSDRQAAGSVRNRIDFKYALGMELEDPGFHDGGNPSHTSHVTRRRHVRHVTTTTAWGSRNAP